MSEYEFSAEVWRWKGESAWHFITLPDDISDEIEATTHAAGFGSVRVEVRVGETTWRTSVFPSNEVKAYVLPIKKAVRLSEGCHEGVLTQVILNVVEQG